MEAETTNVSPPLVQRSDDEQSRHDRNERSASRRCFFINCCVLPNEDSKIKSVPSGAADPSVLL